MAALSHDQKIDVGHLYFGDGGPQFGSWICCGRRGGRGG